MRDVCAAVVVAGMALGMGMAAGPAYGAVLEQSSGEVPGAVPGLTVVLPGFGVHSVDLSGLMASQAQGNAGNEVIKLAVPDGSRVVGIGWDLNLSIVSPGVLSDILIGVVDMGGDGVRVRPAEGSNFPGTLTFASATQTVDRGGLAFDSGSMVFVEVYLDFPGAAGLLMTQSTLWVEIVPAPGGVALLGAGVLLLNRRRR